MRVLSISTLLAAAVAMTACTSTTPPAATPPAATQPGTSQQAHPPSTTASATPTPTASPTPSAEQLAQQAGAAYEVAFAELERLARLGGADQPSSKMLEVETDLYLKQDMALLQFQRKEKIKVEGQPNTTRWRPAPDQAKNGSDPRLTIQICEDRRGSTAVYPDGRRDPNNLSQGFAYGKLVDGRVKLVDVDTKKVAQCAW